MCAFPLVMIIGQEVEIPAFINPSGFMLFFRHQLPVLMRGLMTNAPIELDEIRGLAKPQVIADLFYRPVRIMQQTACFQVYAQVQQLARSPSAGLFADPVQLFGADMDHGRIGLDIPDLPEFLIDQVQELIIAGIVQTSVDRYVRREFGELRQQNGQIGIDNRVRIGRFCMELCLQKVKELVQLFSIFFREGEPADIAQAKDQLQQIAAGLVQIILLYRQTPPFQGCLSLGVQGIVGMGMDDKDAAGLNGVGGVIDRQRPAAFDEAGDDKKIILSYRQGQRLPGFIEKISDLYRFGSLRMQMMLVGNQSSNRFLSHYKVWFKPVYQA